MSFEDYFQIRDDMDLYTQLVNFSVGLAPAMTHLAYMDTSKVDASDHAGPSLACACNIATGLLTSEALVILLKRRRPLLAPCYVQFDALRCLYKKGKLRWGNNGPVQRIKRIVAHKRFYHQKALLEGAAR